MIEEWSHVYPNLSIEQVQGEKNPQRSIQTSLQKYGSLILFMRGTSEETLQQNIILDVPGDLLLHP